MGRLTRRASIDFVKYHENIFNSIRGNSELNLFELKQLVNGKAQLGDLHLIPSVFNGSKITQICILAKSKGDFTVCYKFRAISAGRLMFKYINCHVTN
ncbi:hypothetical protein [Photobacterium leiognathi]|uniref:hypothetical protein n=1 Tax=Photobacterium leiognathi TaxID=553611 RepID=UPI002980AFFA|nr:hypothetical protein [Photobacterium leiognathi]